MLRQENVLPWYELYLVGQRREGTIPFSEVVVLSPAADNDLTLLFKNECVPYLTEKIILAVYSDFSFFDENNPVKVLTLHEEINAEPEVIRKRDKAARDLFSQAVSKV